MTIVNLAGLEFRFEAPSDIDLLFPPAYSTFLTKASKEDLAGTYRIQHADSADAPAEGDGDVLWQTELWRVRRGNDGTWRLEQLNHETRTWHDVASFAPDFSNGIFFAHAHHNGRVAYMFNYPADQFLISNRLSFLQGGVLHGCSILLDGRVYVFCGKSGAGKTTIARLWRDAGARIMNDDRTIIRIIDGEPWAGSTPWHGDEPEVHANCAPLGGVFHLVQSTRNELHALHGAEAVAKIMATTISPYYSRMGIEGIMNSWIQVVARLPSYTLEFTPDAHAIRACAAMMPSISHHG